jgi:hypothetical protein
MAYPQNMLAHDPTSNRKPADELADIRDQIRLLKAREEDLRQKFIAGKVSLSGDDYRVVVSGKTAEILDTAKIRKELGLQFLKPFMRTRETIWVMLRRVDGNSLDNGDGGDDD